MTIVTCRCNEKYEVNKATERHQLNGFWVTYCPYCSAEHYLRSLSATEKKNLTKSEQEIVKQSLQDIKDGKFTDYKNVDYLMKSLKKQAD